MRMIFSLLIIYSFPLFAVEELPNFESALKRIRHYGGNAILFLGHGSKGQLGDLNQVNADVEKVVESIDRRYGTGNWTAIFGGDNYSQDTPDIGYIVHRLKKNHRILTIAIQASKVRDSYGGVDDHLDYVYYYPTQTKVVIADNVVKEKTLWGGVDEGDPVGATKFYLGPQIRSGKALKGVVAFGGGPIAMQELTYALRESVPITYIQTKAKHYDQGAPFGVLDEWMMSLCKSGMLSNSVESIIRE